MIGAQKPGYQRMTKRVCALALLLSGFCIFATAHSAHPALRIALIGFNHTKVTTEATALEAALAQALSRDARVTLMDRSIIQPALTGFGYDGSINLSTRD